MEQPAALSLATSRKTLKLASMKAIAVIPARLASTRLPRKMLREIAGRPLIGWVYQAVQATSLLSDVIIATDSDEILQVCRQHGWNALMTSPQHRSGTGRVHEISSAIAADVYINVQGDEPLVRSEHISSLLNVMEDPDVLVGTLKTPCGPAEIDNPNAVKVVTDHDGRALYFSRATIPFDRDGSSPHYFKHLGLYAYRKALSTGISLCRNRRLSAASGWNSYASSKMDCPSTSPRPHRLGRRGHGRGFGESDADSTSPLIRNKMKMERRASPPVRPQAGARLREPATISKTRLLRSRVHSRPGMACTRREIAGCEWKNHSTKLDGERSARF